MWGICLNAVICDGKLFQRIVEYKVNSDNKSITIEQPCKNISIPINEIRVLDNKPPFVYGELVSPINHPELTGQIESIVWHFKNNDFNFYITIDGKRNRKRYYANDLIKH